MGCGCAKSEGAKVAKPIEAKAQEQQLNKLPTEQCVFCLQKHLDEAWVLWHEYGYTNANRRAIRGNLRAMVLHSFKDYPDIAQKARECALLVQDAKDCEAEKLLQELCILVDEVFYKANPEIQARIDDLKRKIDVVIPLGEGSKADNDELKILLRSLDKHALNLGKVYIITDKRPHWLNDKAIVVPYRDENRHNKDANLIDKTLYAIQEYNLERFAWCADDNVFLQDIRLDEIPIIKNHRKREEYNLGTSWQQRVLNTFDFAKERRINLEVNYESHCPQYFGNARKILDEMRKVEYHDRGLTIMTAFRIVAGETDNDAVMQREVKFTVEMPYSKQDGIPEDKMFCGYNDSGFHSGLREDLLFLFPAKSSFEK